MAVPTAISELSTTPGSNPPAGSDAPSVLDDHAQTAYAFIKTLSDTQVALTGNQTIAGTKTFSSSIVGNLTGNVTGNTSGTSANITGIAAIANGGTGEATAAAAFTALKQAASDTATGVVELATDAEAQAGTDAARAVTPDNLGATVIGIGQTWTNVAGSRGVNITYTNSTGRPIMVSIAIGAAATVGVEFVVGGLTMLTTNVLSNLPCGYTFIVPNGVTYRVNTASSVQNWLELR